MHEQCRAGNRYLPALRRVTGEFRPTSTANGGVLPGRAELDRPGGREPIDLRARRSQLLEHFARVLTEVEGTPALEHPRRGHRSR